MFFRKLVKKKNYSSSLLLLLLVFFAHSLRSNPDSLGLMRTQAGWFITHQIDSAETLYALSRRYLVSVEDILRCNDSLEATSLKPGATVFIPYEADVKLEQADLSPGIVHEVKVGETLYRISKQYEVSIPQLLEANPSLANLQVKSGQQIRIPGELVQEPAPLPEQAASTPDSSLIVKGVILHKVSLGETLFAIGKRYGGLSLQYLRDVNKLRNDTISPGQPIIIGRRIPAIRTDSMIRLAFSGRVAADTLFQFRPRYDTLKTATGHRPGKFEIDFMAYINEGRTFQRHKGISTWLADNSSSLIKIKNYYALHNEAEAGSVIKVRNLMNGKIIYAKVIGSIPDNRADRKSIVKVSYEAAQELGALDARFPAEVEYVVSKPVQPAGSTKPSGSSPANSSVQ